MSTNWERVEDLFAHAVDLPPGERLAFLDRTCAGAPQLRDELESLLRAHEQAESSFTTRSLAVRDILGALGRSLLTGQALGTYQLGAIIGEGGMGIVYRAVDRRSDTPVAVKVLPHELSLDSPWRKRFSREVRATAAIDHPNVVRILDYGEDRGCLYLVMELIEGESLRDLLSRGALRLETALDCGIQIAAALQAAHSAGVIHHDLKPGNIMLTPSGKAKVVDFGLSRFEDDSGPDPAGSRFSQADTPAGTIDYLSPEQAGGRPVDQRSDLFAAGSVLYEMLSGRRAFHRSTNLETAAAILRDRPEPLPESVPAPLARLVERCLAKDAGRRVQSAAELGRLLEVLLAKLRRGRLKPRRFRLARRVALWAVPTALLAGALVIGLPGGRPFPRRPLRFQQLTADPHLTIEPALSLDGRWLAYASDRAEDGNVDVWIQPTGQGEARRMTDHPAMDHQPALSPDGSLLAFRSEREPAGIYIEPVHGGGERLLAAGGREPRFSPNGQWIAWWAGPEVRGDAQAVIHSAIYVAPSSGGAARRLAAEFSDAGHPVWAPDSASLLFAGHRKAGGPDAEFWVAPLEGGEPKLKARWERELGNSIGPPVPFAWTHDNTVLFRWFPVRLAKPSTQIWSMRFSDHPETPVVEQLTSGPGPYTWLATDRTGRVVAASGTARSNLWSLAIDPETGAARGFMTPLVEEGEKQLLLSMTADGKRALFQTTDRRGAARYLLQDLESGQQNVVGMDPAVTSAMLTRDGRTLVLHTRSAGNAGVKLPLPAGITLRLSRLLETQWDVSGDGAEELAAALSQPRSVNLESHPAEDSTPLLQHPSYNLYLANFSFDDRWAMVTAENGVDPPHLFAAPLRRPYPIPVSSWVDLGEGSFGRWAPAGNRIYFLRDHQGSRCIYTRALDSRTKQPLGEATAVLHLHSAWRSTLQLEPGYFRMIAASDRLVFALGEAQSNLWLAEPPR